MLTTSNAQAKTNLPVSQKSQLPVNRSMTAHEKLKTMLFAFNNQLNRIAKEIGNQLFWTGDAPTGLEVDLVKQGGKLSHESSLYMEHELLKLIKELGDYALKISSLTYPERLHHFNACCNLYTRDKKEGNKSQQAPSARDELTTPILQGAPRPEDGLHKKKRRNRK
jgi:hypothetical protein